MNSSRFPGKMICKLGEHRILEWVLIRTLMSKELDLVVLATSKNEQDDKLSDIATELGVKVFRGEEDDVLDRFVGALECYPAKNVIRICADNPFIDAKEIDRLVRKFLSSDCDYAFNNLSKLNGRYADGFGAEILSGELIKTYAKSNCSQAQREHVTKLIWDNLEKYEVLTVKAPDALAFPDFHFDIDRPADHKRLCKLVEAGINIDSSAKEIIKISMQLDI